MREEPNERLRIEIRENSIASDDLCPLCHGLPDPCGLNFFATGKGIVCGRCANEHRPELRIAVLNALGRLGCCVGFIELRDVENKLERTNTTQLLSRESLHCDLRVLMKPGTSELMMAQSLRRIAVLLERDGFLREAMWTKEGWPEGVEPDFAISHAQRVEMARRARGGDIHAIDDLLKELEWHPNFTEAMRTIDGLLTEQQEGTGPGIANSADDDTFS